jgi:hypothetical protein
MHDVIGHESAYPTFGASCLPSVLSSPRALIAQ